MYELQVTASFGTYDVKLVVNPHEGDYWYHVTLQRIPEQCEPGRAYAIWRAEFNMIWTGREFKKLRYKKSPADPDYWIEMEQLLSAHFIAMCQ